MSPDLSRIESLGAAIGRKSLEVLVAVCPDLREASSSELDAVCAAMRLEAGRVSGEFLADVKESPWMSEAIFQAACLDLAHVGVRAFKEGRK